MTYTFPTKEQFEAWFKGKRNIRYKFKHRAESCPIALCLRARGIPQAVVYSEYWCKRRGYAIYPLPPWARRAVRKFDVELRKGKEGK